MISPHRRTIPVFVTVSVEGISWLKQDRCHQNTLKEEFVSHKHMHETHRRLPLRQGPASDARQESHRLFDRTFYLK